MHTSAVLHKLLSQSVPSIHQVRLSSFVDTVDSLTRGTTACVTQLGRGLNGHSYDKHKIKRVDRLLSNRHLYQECDAIYTTLTKLLLKTLTQVVIIIDWSPLCADQGWQLLRAAIPVGGRSMTLYEQVHPQSKLGNRQVQHQFLAQLATMVPSTCDVIIIGDSGFKTPFYRYIEQHLGWHWIGRIRGKDYMCSTHHNEQWVKSNTLYQKATTRAKKLGRYQWVRSNPLCANLVIIRRHRKHRITLNHNNQPRKCRRTYVHTRRAQDPWLLVASRSLQTLTAQQIVNLYQTRMQIEEGFRDTKSHRFGMGISQYRHMNPRRRAILCLIASCAQFVLWCIGTVAKQSQQVQSIRVNSASKRLPYSAIFLATLLLKQKRFKPPAKFINDALKEIQAYAISIL